MNKYIRKSLALIIALAVFSVIFTNNAFAVPQVINQSVEKQNITSGVVLEYYTRFTTSGWINSNVLRVDLQNENVKVDSLVNKTSVTGIKSVRNLADSAGALAAVNASFFDMEKGDAFGSIMSNGEFAMASAKDNNTQTAGFSLDNLNNALFAYWDTKIDLITPSGNTRPVAAYNRYTGFYNYKMYIVDTKWGSKTPGVSKNYPNWLEMVVEDGVVKEFSENKPGIDIPKNGYVVLATMGDDKYLKDNFKVGDPVDYDITLSVDSANMKTALTGGTLLVKDGNVITNFTHSPTLLTTRAPRTAVGTTADGKTLLIVTVDGRSRGGSIGMTQAELASYMKELGCTNAINFDGGGSTTMVAREEGNTGLSLVNAPSDGFERGVSASLGVFSIGPKGPVDSLLVTAYEKNVFVNTSRAFTAKGLDKYLNPVDVDQKAIQWSATGVKGSFKDNVFYPASAGEAVITAKIGDTVIGTCPISVLSAPVKVNLNYDTLNTEPEKTTTLTLKGWDKNGFSASIPPVHVKWGVVGKAGTIESNVFTAGKSGTGYVSASIAGASVYCPVSIKQPGAKKVLDEFSEKSLIVDPSAKSVTAKYDQATNAYKSAPYSGKLTYDFNKEVNTSRAAYINLPNGGHALDSTTTKLGLWVYSSAKKPVSVGAMVYDTKGKVYYKYFAKSISWTGWKYLEVSLSDIKDPSKITKVYAAQSTKQKASGTLYFDNLTMIYSGYPEVPASSAAKTTVPKDEFNKDRSVSGNDSFIFSVFGQDSEYNADKDKTQTAMINTLAATINKYIQASVVVGKYDSLSPKIKVPLLSTTASYKSLDRNGSRLIQLNTVNGGLRSTNSNEWFWLKDQLSSFDGNNLFVLLAENPENFNDSKEGALLKETLTDYKKQNPKKNVWVLYKGSANTSYMDRGVKYISTAGFDTAGFSPSNKSAAKYVVIKAKGNTVTYQFKSFN